MLSYIRHMIHWYETLRTRAETKTPKADYDDSETYMSFRYFGSLVRIYFSLIIGRISEYMWVKTLQKSITTFDNYAMLICFKKFIAQDD